MTAPSSPPSTLLDRVPEADQSVQVVNSILGPGWPDILSGGHGAGSLMFDLLAAFNAVALAIVSVMVFYTVLVGTVGTAHEGETLGKRYSTLWTPLRSATAVSMLMPLPWANVSLLQAIVLKSVFLGIGGADYLTDKAVDYMAAHGGQITAQAAAPDVQKAAEAVFLNLLVIAYAAEFEGRQAANAPGGMAGGTTTGLMLRFPVPAGISPEDMGYVALTCKHNENVCQERAGALGDLTEEMRSFAKAIVSRHEGGADIQPDLAAVSRAIDTYGARVQEAIRTQKASMDPDTHLTNFAAGVKARGWAALGSWYWTLAGYNEQANQLKIGEISAQEPNLERISPMLGAQFGDYVKRARGYFQRLQAARSVDNLESLSLGGDGTDGLGDLVLRKMTGHFADLGAQAAHAMSAGDPVANMQSLGHMMIDTGVVGIAIIKAISSRMPSSSDKADEGDGLASSAIGWATSKVSRFLPSAETVAGITSMMSTACWVLLFAGVGLAYYLPAVPFVLWTMAVIGWAVQVVEAMFAMPVWAAAHALPEGEGLAGQHGRQGYLLLLGILVRPALMVAGFFAAFLCMGVVGNLVGDGYQVFTAGAVGGTLNDGHTSGGWVAGAWGAAAGGMAGGGLAGAAVGAVALPVGIGLIGLLATLFIGGGIIIVAVHKVFALITWLPDHVLKWAGAAAQSMDEHGSENRIAMIFANSVQRGQSGLGGGPGALMGIGKEKALPKPGGGGDPDRHAPGRAD